MSADTFAALATPAGESALAVIRINGSAVPALSAALTGRSQPLPARRAVHSRLFDQSGRVVDDCVFLFYASPASPTGGDVLEITCHGNPLIVRRILDDLLARGVRDAEPGEFTRTAFLNGRLDLSQAEAVMDLIRARSDRALEAARRQLRGDLGARVNHLCDRLLGVIAHLEAYIDFPEEDLPGEDDTGPARDLAELTREFDQLIATQKFRDILHEGVKTVILGRPNAGKSSLLNALAGEERALVSEEPGTTRDFVETPVMAGPYRLRLTDTAGLRGEASGVELLGIRKSLEQADRADLILIVMDASLPPPELPASLLPLLDPSRTLVVENKADLPRFPALDTFLPGLPRLRVSARSGEGLDTLRQALVRLVETGLEVPGEEAVLVSSRHADALRETKENVALALAKLRASEPSELVAADLRAALAALGRILGKVDNERMLDKLFATFCIGK